MPTRRRILAAIGSLALSAPCPAQCTIPDLLVTSRFSDNVLQYSATIGSFRRVFATGGGLDNPVGAAFGPDGVLYVANSLANNVIRFSSSGAPLGPIVPTGAGGLNGPNFVVFRPRPCCADLNADEVVNSSDLAILLALWSAGPHSIADLNADGVVSSPDLAQFLASWGPCGG